MTLPLTHSLLATKLSLDASAATERRFLAALGSGGAASWCRAAHGGFDQPQPGWSKLTGQNAEEQAGMGWLAALHFDDRARVERAWRDGALRGALSTTYRVRDASGRWREMAERATVFDSADGLPARAICMAEDLGAFGFAEGRLYGGALDAAGMGAWEVDLLQGSLDCSSRCKAIHGWSTSDSFGLNELALVVSAADRELLLSEASRALANGEEFSVEYRITIPDGPPRWARVQGRRAAGALGEHRLSGVCADITDAKRRDEAERERGAQTALQNARKSEFLAVLGHELRNPLAPIRNGLQALRARGGDPAERERLRSMVERHVSHMAHLINDLRDVARVERGELELRLETFDARDPLRVAIEECSPLIEAKGHALTVAGFEQPVIIHGDATRLAQMASNLLNNAAKYTPDGGEIGLKISILDGRLRVCVSDNGVGLERTSLDRVFGMFEQVGEQKRCSDGGLGIGLALTRKLAELHGGTVTASSEGLGQGCRFLINIPLGSAAERELERLAPSDLDVLVVNDSQDAAETLALLIDALGHRARIAGSGAAAIAAAALRLPDIAFLDISMPGMGGVELARALRARGQARIPVLIALTGHAREDLGVAAADFDNVLAKPAGLEDIAAALADAAKRGSG